MRNSETKRNTWEMVQALWGLSHIVVLVVVVNAGPPFENTTNDRLAQFRCQRRSALAHWRKSLTENCVNDPEGEPEPEEDNSDEENQPAEDRNEEGNTVSNAECADDDEESGHEIKENNNGKDDHIEGKLSQAKHLL